MKKILFLTLSGVAVLALWHFAAETAQAECALSGLVRTPGGKPLVGVVLRLQRDGKETAPPEVTDTAGRYCFKNIKEAGEYVLAIEPPAGSFKPASVKIALKLGVNNVVNVTLAPLKGDVTTVVSKERPVVLGQGTTAYSADFLEGTANIGKDVQAAIASVPSVTLDQEGEIVASGSRQYESKLRLGNTSAASSFAACRIVPPAHGGTTPPNGEAFDATFFKHYGVNPFVDTEDDRFSTFAVDVDTASYSVARSYLDRGHLPPKESVRVEEFVNSFRYGYRPPQEEAFRVYAEGAPSKFGGPRHQMLRIAVQGKKVEPLNRKPAVLTFVVDVSGSMQREDRLELVKKSLRLLVDELRAGDRVGIVTYGSTAQAVLPHTGIEDRKTILRAIDSLYSEGSTYAEAGLRMGYAQAEAAFRPSAINRVILCTDGVANVGQTGADDILKTIQAQVQKGITMSALGFGMENFNDVLLEKLGDKGNGHYAYIDGLDEARRVFVENLTGTLQVIARDVKIQVEFNPEAVQSYRLLGYENRDVRDQDFRDDKVDGGEIGAGHSVTALYELKVHDDADPRQNLATVFVRWKDADGGGQAREVEQKITPAHFHPSFEAASPAFRLAAAAAEFSEILRESYWAREASLDAVLDVAQSLQPAFPRDAQAVEFASLVLKAKRLQDERKRREQPEKPDMEAYLSED